MASPITIISAATAAPSPPTQWGMVPSAQARDAVITEYDLELWSTATVNLTAAKLLGATLQAQVLADDGVDGVDTTDNELDITSHAYQTGDGPVQLTTAGTLPGGLAVSTDYWVIKVTANAIGLATSFAKAMAGTKIDLTAGSSGAHTVVDTADTKRVHWFSHGNLGEAADGAVALTATRGYRVRVKHSKRVLAYALSATFSDTQPVTGALYPADR